MLRLLGPTLPLPAPNFQVFDALSAQTLLRAMRCLFPHAALGDTPYVECVRAIDARAQQDGAYRELISTGLARLPRGLERTPRDQCRAA